MGIAHIVKARHRHGFRQQFHAGVALMGNLAQEHIVLTPAQVQIFRKTCVVEESLAGKGQVVAHPAIGFVGNGTRQILTTDGHRVVHTVAVSGATIALVAVV